MGTDSGDSVKVVRLLKPHTHEGQRYPIGALLPLEARVADWLIDQGKAKSSSNAAPRQTPKRIVRRSCCGG